jgi:hypothetical protein
MCYISARKWRREASAIPSKDAGRQEGDASCTDGCVCFLIYANFPYFEKMKVGLSDHHAVCPPINS